MTLPPFLLLPLILAWCVLIGAAVQSWARPWATDGLAWLVGTLGVGVLLNGWLALVLAEVGQFHLGWLFLGGLVVLAASWPRRAAWGPVGLAVPPTGEMGFLASWLLVAAALFLRPHQFISGGADAGVYVNLSANIARTGGLTLHHDSLTALDPALYPALLRAQPASTRTAYYWQPALTVDDPATAEITPRFYHLAPVWQAVGYAMGALAGSLAFTPLWAWLGGLMLYMVARRLWGWPWAAVVALALTSNALQSWFARYPTTEALTQMLVWLGVWAFVAWQESDEQAGFWAGLAGAAWGSTFLARIDTFFIAAVPAIVVLGWLARRRWPRSGAYFMGFLVLLPLHSALHGWFLTRPYFLETFGLVGLVLGRNGTAVAGAAAVGLALGGLVVWQGARVGQWVVRHGRRWQLAAVIFLLLLAAYNWWVRPWLGGTAVWNDWYGGQPITNYDHENLRRLGWYFTPLGIALAVGGSALLLARPERRTWAVLLLGLLFTALYVTNIRANPIQIYAMRRYVPVVLPFGVLAAVAALRGLAGWRPAGRGAAVGLALLWLGWQSMVAWPFVRQVDSVALPAQLETFAADFPPRAILIFNSSEPVGQGDILGTPLALLYGVDVYVVREAAALSAEPLRQTIGRWQAAGHAVYWVEVPNGHPWPLTAAELAPPLPPYHIAYDVLEEVYHTRPSQVLTFTWDGTVYPIQESN